MICDKSFFGRFSESDAIKPDLIKQLVNNHRELFEQYVDEAISGKEQKILTLKQAKQELLNSRSYKIGEWLTMPYRFFKKIGRI